MADKTGDVAGENELTQGIAPELLNPQQEDESYQAQTLADEALGRRTDDFGLDDTEKVTTGDDSDDVQDLVDHMRQMVSSGLIDNSAFRGEPDLSDDDDGYLPEAGEDPEARSDA